MLRISKSQIQTYLICPRKFWFQYVIGALPEFVPASVPFGRALHAAVAAFYRALKESATKPALDFIQREFMSLSFKLRLGLQNARADVGTTCASRALAPQVSVEKAVPAS